MKLICRIMKIVIVFYQGKEVTRVKCTELVLMGNGFKLLTSGNEVARFLNDYDYALHQEEKYFFTTTISSNDLVRICNTQFKRNELD